MFSTCIVWQRGTLHHTYVTFCSVSNITHHCHSGSAPDTSSFPEAFCLVTPPSFLPMVCTRMEFFTVRQAGFGLTQSTGISVLATSTTVVISLYRSLQYAPVPISTVCICSDLYCMYLFLSPLYVPVPISTVCTCSDLYCMYLFRSLPYVPVPISTVCTCSDLYCMYLFRSLLYVPVLISTVCTHLHVTHI